MIIPETQLTNLVISVSVWGVLYQLSFADKMLKLTVLPITFL